jgi:inosine/xanthosine triphosphatase
MKKVIIASDNPVKIKVAEQTFKAVFPDEEFEFIGIKSDSGVGDQPVGEETRLGAENRLKFIQTKYPEADYFMSQEGGVFQEGDKLYNRAWIMISDRDGFVGESSTSHFYLPTEIVKHMKDGLELGHAGDKFFSTTNIKHSSGVIGELTNGIYNRADYYTQAGIVALSTIVHKDWYQ